jgi:hypothetical protein
MVIIFVVIIISILHSLPSTAEGEQVSESYPLAITSDDESYPQIAIDARGYFHVIYTIANYETDIYHIAYLKVKPNGTILQGPKILSPPGLSILGSEDICIDIEGMIHVVFTGYDGDGGRIVYYTKLNRDGEIVIDAMALTTKNNASWGPSIDTDRYGNAYIVWSDNGPPFLIYWMKLSSNGSALKSPRIISDHFNKFKQTALPHIEVSETGESYVVWNQMNTSFNTWSIHFTSLSPDGTTIQGPKEVISDPVDDNWGVSSTMDSKMNLHLTFMYSDPFNEFSIGYAMVDKEGTLLKEETIDDPPPNEEAWWSHISIDPSDNVYIAYQRESDEWLSDWNIFLLIYRSEGDEWEKRIQLTTNSRSQSTAIVAGYSHSGIVYELGHKDIYLVTVGPVVINNPPVPILSSSNTTHDIDESAILNGALSFDPDDGDYVREYYFDWGDNSYSDWTTSSTAEHLFNAKGRYEVKLRIRDSRGLESDEPAIITINVTSSKPNLPPVAVIANPSDGVEYSIVNRILVDANGSFDPDGDEISYEWYLNDQVEPIALGMNAWLDLTQGRYRLTLSVEDNSGASADSSVTFQVTDELDPISENQVSEEIWILLFIIIIIIIVLVSLFNLRTKKKNELR